MDHGERDKVALFEIGGRWGKEIKCSGRELCIDGHRWRGRGK